MLMAEKKNHMSAHWEKKIQEYLMCENRTPVRLLRIMKSRVLSTVCVALQLKLPEALLISLANFSKIFFNLRTEVFITCRRQGLDGVNCKALPSTARNHQCRGMWRGAWGAWPWRSWACQGAPKPEGSPANCLPPPLRPAGSYAISGVMDFSHGLNSSSP